MLDIILKGLMIGVFSSIPVGPIAILCIQRTLNRGRNHGFFTGLGAALSDLGYASLAAFSMSFIVDFIHQHQFYIEFGGAFIILIFGFVIFKSNPMKKISVASEKKESYFQDFITSFALTMTNPLMIFLFIGLYARFDFVGAEFTLVSSVLGLLAVFVGAALWWFVLTFCVNLFRSKFNVRGLWLINKIAGLVLVGIAIFGIVFSIINSGLE